MAKTITTPSKTTLRKAAGLLQEAHDYIEANGFDIQHYGHNLKENVEAGRSPAQAMCYIGTLRFSAGIYPGSGFSEDAAEGDGPELTLALKTLDDLATVALKRGEPELLEAIPSNPLNMPFQTGRFIEHLGFLIDQRAERKFPEDEKKQEAYQKAYALKILRKALTKIYR